MKFGLGSVIILLLLLVGPWPAAAQYPSTGSGDFRGANWGQTPLEVEQMEDKAPFHRDDQLVIFRDEFQGAPAEVIYFFLENKLVMGFTHLLAEHDDLDKYFNDYEDLKSALGQRLGAPDVENWQLSLPELEEDRSLWAEALGFGLIKAEAGWLIDNTGIALRLSGGNFKGHLMMVHFSRADMNAGRKAYRDYFARNIGVPNEYFQH